MPAGLWRLQKALTLTAARAELLRRRPASRLVYRQLLAAADQVRRAVILLDAPAAKWDADPIRRPPAWKM